MRQAIAYILIFNTYVSMQVWAWWCALLLSKKPVDNGTVCWSTYKIREVKNTYTWIAYHQCDTSTCCSECGQCALLVSLVSPLQKSIPIVPSVDRQHSLQMRYGCDSLAFGLGNISPVVRSHEAILTIAHLGRQCMH